MCLARGEWAWKPETGSQPLRRGVYASIGDPRGAFRRLPPYYHHRRLMRPPREPRGPILSGEWRELGITGNVRSAAATASRLYRSRLEVPTSPLRNPWEGADRPPARNSPRRTPQVARSAVALSDNILRNLAIQKTYGFVVRKSAYRYTFGVLPTVQKSDLPRVQNL